MELTKKRPEKNGFYWAFAEIWGPGIKSVLIEVRGGLYRTVHSEHGWGPVESIDEQYVFAGPIRPPEIPRHHPERRGAERVKIGGA